MTQIMPEERLTRDEMADAQLSALQGTLAYAYQKVDFYRHLFQEKGIEPHDIKSLDQWVEKHLIREKGWKRQELKPETEEGDLSRGSKGDSDLLNLEKNIEPYKTEG